MFSQSFSLHKEYHTSQLRHVSMLKEIETTRINVSEEETAKSLGAFFAAGSYHLLVNKQSFRWSNILYNYE